MSGRMSNPSYVVLFQIRPKSMHYGERGWEGVLAAEGYRSARCGSCRSPTVTGVAAGLYRDVTLG